MSKPPIVAIHPRTSQPPDERNLAIQGLKARRKNIVRLGTSIARNHNREPMKPAATAASSEPPRLPKKSALLSGRRLGRRTPIMGTIERRMLSIPTLRAILCRLMDMASQIYASSTATKKCRFTQLNRSEIVAVTKSHVPENMPLTKISAKIRFGHPMPPTWGSMAKAEKKHSFVLAGSSSARGRGILKQPNV